MIKKIKQFFINAWAWIKRNVKAVLIGIGIVGVATAATLIANPQVPDVALENMQTKYEESDIKAKYQMKGASLVHNKIKNPELTKNGKPKDEIEITIGEENEDNFVPNIKIKRWDEVWFKIKPRLDGIDIDDMELEFEDNKIKFKTPEMEIEFEDFEDSYKMIWYLNSKPDSSIVSFDIESDGVDFFYQPELTQKKIDEGYIRPDNVVGSYAVYASEQKTNWTDGKEYKVGKVGHIYRPRLKDSNNWEVWGDLHIENGVYEVTIPQDFYDNAVYPIRSNDTFGYEVVGVSTFGIVLTTVDQSRRVGHGGVSITESGTLDKLSVALGLPASGSQTLDVTAFINHENTVTDSHSLIASAELIGVTIDEVAADAIFHDFTAASEELSIDTVILNVVGDGRDVSATVGVNLDDSGSRTNYFETFAGGGSYPNSQEDPWTETDSTGDNLFSIYATYTPAGAEERRIIIIQ